MVQIQKFISAAWIYLPIDRDDAILPVAGVASALSLNYNFSNLLVFWIGKNCTLNSCSAINRYRKVTLAYFRNSVGRHLLFAFNKHA
jgi:hypothetical protein